MTIAELNRSGTEQRKAVLGKCCGAKKWVEKMDAIFPVAGADVLLAAAERTWFQCSKEDWLEAFAQHPKIGDINSLKEKYAATSTWAEGEQSSVKQTSAEVLQALAAGNTEYEEKFGYIFIVCATGKSAQEMLDMLLIRLKNNAEQEIQIAMEEQNKITALRLKKLLAL
ncbi:MAG: 2-oxo-4-hydroxy-4-carboxy-5-ureidoimidazoline decarboxylase [Bacteroidota bacterium]